MSDLLLQYSIKNVEKAIEDQSKLFERMMERIIANQENIIKQNKEQILNQQLLIEALKKRQKVRFPPEK